METAIGGYDVVAYFLLNQATKGAQEFVSEYDGKRWQFMSADHKRMFDENPVRFLPQYGGYCSWAMAKGNTVRVDPTCFAVVDNKLYLNFSKRIHKKWQKRSETLIELADAKWPSVKSDSGK